MADPTSRIVRVLLDMAQQTQTSRNGAVEIELRVSPSELSERVGLEVEAVTPLIFHLRDAGHLRVEGEVFFIPDLQTLEQLSQLLELKEEIRATATPDPFQGSS